MCGHQLVVQALLCVAAQIPGTTCLSVLIHTPCKFLCAHSGTNTTTDNRARSRVILSYKHKKGGALQPSAAQGCRSQRIRYCQ
eukprot:862475-Pelagomonas_calceolata.AAC.1